MDYGSGVWEVLSPMITFIIILSGFKESLSLHLKSPLFKDYHGTIISAFHSPTSFLLLFFFFTFLSHTQKSNLVEKYSYRWLREIKILPLSPFGANGGIMGWWGVTGAHLQSGWTT